MDTMNKSNNPLFLQESNLKSGLLDLCIAEQTLKSSFNDVLAKHDLNHMDMRILMILQQQPNIAVQELLLLLHTSKQYVHPRLKALQKRGFIVRKSDLKDRRKRLLNLTESGAILEKELCKLPLRIMEQAYTQAGMEAVDGFNRVLKMILS